MKTFFGGVALVLGIVVAGCNTTSTPTLPSPSRTPLAFRAEKLAEIDRIAGSHVAAGELPGGVIWLEHHGSSHPFTFGNRTVEPAREAMTVDTLFDAASLTKVIATTPSILRLVESGRLDLDDPVARHLPAFAAHGKVGITVRHLLTHTSGLRPGLPAGGDWSGPAAALALACAETPTQPPGTRFVYSDINFIVLGELVRARSGRPLDEFARAEVFRPLGMLDTGYLPLANGFPVGRIAPTERQSNGACLRGIVHDPTARRMGGVAGHAGLFTTAADLARYGRMLLHQGELDGHRILRRETVAAMTSLQTGAGIPARGLGWDIDSPYAGPRGRHFGAGSYGHTGWTGTSLWIDPPSDTFIILLSNRNHPTEAGDVRTLRRELGTLAAEALADVEWPPLIGGLFPSATGEQGGRTDDTVGAGAAGPVDAGVLQGIDVWERDGFPGLRGLRVGLVTNHTGRDRGRRATIDLLKAAPGVELVALFSPEHGIRGVQDEKVGDSRDEATGLPVYSLYGERHAPSAEQLTGLDVLVFDIQDIGCRFYTYISTLGNCLEAAGMAHKRFIVLDRVNPVNGIEVEGPVLTAAHSFVAWHEIPVRHGMTTGELAGLFNAERHLGADLTVIRCEGWHRADWFDATQLPWTNPSPNMRSLNAATLYPGVGLLEYCAVSVGRGTGTPFELIGAPYIDDRRFAGELNAAELPGVRFIPTRFTPTASVFQGKECGGVQMVITDRTTLRATDLGVVLAATLQRLYPNDLKLEKMATLLGDPPTLEAIRTGRPLSEIRTVRDRLLPEFLRRRQRHLLY